MTDLQAPAIPAVVLRRTYNAPRERVYAAWTQPETAMRFLGPGPGASKVRMDVRTGGTYSITMQSEKYGEMIVEGVYRIVQPPELLEMTWRWREDDPADEHESLLTLEFHEVKGGTELVLTHKQFAELESRNRHEGGWSDILDQLAVVL